MRNERKRNEVVRQTKSIINSQVHDSEKDDYEFSRNIPFSTTDNSVKTDSSFFVRIVKWPLVVLVIIGSFHYYHHHIHEDAFKYKELGFVACLSVYFLSLVDLSVIHSQFSRPHAFFWKLSFLSSVAYQIALILIFFQTADGGRRWLQYIDPGLGQVLGEPSHGDACVIYDVSIPENPYHNLWLKLDIYVVTHFFGWWLKVLILRDWWISTMISVAFELLEYTFEHQLPYFAECWWDHWILDILVCNGLGILVGVKTLQYFKLEPYEWRHLWKHASLKNKSSIGLEESVNEFNWETTLGNMLRFFAVVGVIFAFVLAELSTFYLKFVLWIPHNHWLNAVRLLPVLFWGAASLKETFEFLSPTNKRKVILSQTWLLLAIVTTEFLIAAKFDYETVTSPIPWSIKCWWIAAIGVFIGWTIWNFELARLLTFLSTRASGLFKVKFIDNSK